MKKLIGIVLVTMSMATPALAQYYETGNRSGYWAPGRVVTTAPARAIQEPVILANSLMPCRREATFMADTSTTVIPEAAARATISC
jgi:hypothetical protein